METKDNVCKLAPYCKKAGKVGYCNALCSPFLLLHGEGDKGLWNATNVPPKYKNSFFATLPIKNDNPMAHNFIKAYTGNILENVQNGVGLFFYSIPNADNRLGTGTGKTTSAVAILHEYLLARVKEQSTGGRVIETNPALFYKASELQTLYNSQFRGTFEMQEKASLRYYKVKNLLMKAELLVFDDIGIRQKITDAFENELTEIIDARDSKMLMTIYTSNLPLEKLADTLGDRIASRIEGMTEPIAFKGKDHRKGGILK
ncbi:DNA replication protein [Bacillus cereus group sp. Bc015]|uniref:DNA replication protein n=1 Tax=Bacillus cereus group sp. Bc015 TaxID=3018123 RepID=UPI0022E159F6|nr:DNA replication protein [Bacillus cereus group sp. Bc015]MDA2738444.1 DNA replication protein [Bacillus cereus group sp. Bc015]